RVIAVNAGVENRHADAGPGDAEIVPDRIRADEGVGLRHQEDELTIGINFRHPSQTRDRVDLRGGGERAERVEVVESDRSRTEILNRVGQLSNAGDRGIEVHDGLDMVIGSSVRQLGAEHRVDENALSTACPWWV